MMSIRMRIDQERNCWVIDDLIVEAPEDKKKDGDK